MATVDFYFDFGSPWAYLASTRIEALSAEHGATLVWHPMDLARVKTLVERPDNPPPCSAQFANVVADVTRWSERYGVRVQMPVQAGTNPALVGCFIAREAGQEAAYIHRVFKARWADGEDLAEPGVQKQIAADVGLESDAMLAALRGDGDQTSLEAGCQEAAGRGVFGIPTTCIGDELFWGNDRLDFVAEALARG